MWAKREENGLVLQEDSPILYELNTVACQIWELIDGKRSEEDIATEIWRRYPDQSLSQIMQDTAEFLSALEENHLVIFRLEDGEMSK